MNTKDLINIGVPQGEPIKLAHEFIVAFRESGGDMSQLENEIGASSAIRRHSSAIRCARRWRAALSCRLSSSAKSSRRGAVGRGLEAEAVKQMANACALPVAVAGALMPDAHVGYGLPIGGVLATENAVIPYAVGVDIACRMKLTVFDRRRTRSRATKDRLANIIERETRFGIGCAFKQRRDHEVMDEDWTRLAGDAADARQGVDAARHERLRQSLRRVRRVHAGRQAAFGLPELANTSRC